MFLRITLINGLDIYVNIERMLKITGNLGRGIVEYER